MSPNQECRASISASTAVVITADCADRRRTIAVRERDEVMSVRPLTRTGPVGAPFAMGHSVG